MSMGGEVVSQHALQVVSQHALQQGGCAIPACLAGGIPACLATGLGGWVCSGGGCLLLGCVENPPRKQTATDADGTHPTGMHSC